MDDYMRSIGKLDREDSNFYAGVIHEKKVALEAFDVVIDQFYNSGFDPTIDYKGMFKNLLNE